MRKIHNMNTDRIKEMMSSSDSEMICLGMSLLENISLRTMKDIFGQSRINCEYLLGKGIICINYKMIWIIYRYETAMYLRLNGTPKFDDLLGATWDKKVIFS